MEKSQFEAASIQFRRAVQANRNSAEAHYDLASSLIKLGRWQEALSELRATTAINPKYNAAHLAAAEILLSGKSIAPARDEITSVLNSDANNVKAHLLLGDTWLADQDYGKALKEFALCEQLEPGNPGPFVQEGAIHLRQGDYAEAIRVLGHAVELDPTLVPAYLYLLQAYRGAKQPQAELAMLQKAIAKNPKQTMLYLLVADDYRRDRRAEEIAPLFAQLRSQTSDALETLIAIGDFYFRTGEVEHARDLFVQALAKNPKNDVVRRRLIEITLNQQDWDYAEKLNKELLTSKPKDVDGRLFEARLQFARGATAKAISNLELLIHDSPELPLPHFYLAVGYARQGQAARAIAAFNETVQKNPDFIWAYVSLGELYSAQGSPKLALEFASQALRRNPDFLPARLLEANVLLQSGDSGTAAQKFHQLLVDNPKSPVILDRYAVALLAEKQAESAESQLEAALLAQPSYTPALLDLIRLYTLQKRQKQILPRVELQIQRSPGQSALYEILGDLQFGAKDLGHALESFSTAERLDSSSAAALLGLSHVYAAQGKFPEASSSAKKLLSIHSDFMLGYLELGQLLEQSGSYEEAEKTYQQALERNQDYAPALNNLAWLYCEHGGNLDMALSLAQKAQARYPTDPAISDTVAWIEYKKGLLASAATSLREVTKRAPQSGVYQYHYGMTLWKMERLGDAKSALNRALGLKLAAPQAEEARRVLTSLERNSLPAESNSPTLSHQQKN